MWLQMAIEYHHLYYQIFSNSSFSTLLSFGFENKTIVYTKKKFQLVVPTHLHIPFY